MGKHPTLRPLAHFLILQQVCSFFGALWYLELKFSSLLFLVKTCETSMPSLLYILILFLLMCLECYCHLHISRVSVFSRVIFCSLCKFHALSKNWFHKVLMINEGVEFCNHVGRPWCTRPFLYWTELLKENTAAFFAIFIPFSNESTWQNKESKEFYTAKGKVTPDQKNKVN